MESEGIVLNDPEPMPVDPHSKRHKIPQPSYTTPSEYDQMQQFLTMDRKVKEIPSIPNSLDYKQLLIEKTNRCLYPEILHTNSSFRFSTSSCFRCCVSSPCGTILTLCSGRPGLLPSSITWWTTRWRSERSTSPTVAGITSRS